MVIRWIHGAEEFPEWQAPDPEPIVPGRLRPETETTEPTGLRSWNTHNGQPAITIPADYLWPEIEEKGKCCGEDCKYQVIQFARAGYDTRDPRFYHGRDWALDILDSQKKEAREDDHYDPRFTTNPRRHERGRTSEVEVEVEIDGKRQTHSRLQQFDGPGMNRFLYDQLSGKRGETIFLQQFLAFLICDYKRGSRTQWRGDLIRENAKFVAAVLFTVRWEFNGRDPRTGLPRRPTVTAFINDRLDTSEEEWEYLRCQPILDLMLQVNGLIDGYERPEPAETRRLPRDEASDLANRIETDSIQAPTPEEVNAHRGGN